MRNTSHIRHAPFGVALLSLVALTACRSAAHEPSPRTAPAPEPAPIVQPGAPGQAGRVLDAQQATALPRVRHAAADVSFMQGMIAHHAQALQMTALLLAGSGSEGMRLLATRIEVSQRDEIAMMQAWLRARGEQAPGSEQHHAHVGALMPGMLTADEMAQLAAASGGDLDRLFLQLMIKHHEGALIMVQELFSSPGAGQEAEIYAFASDVDADQRMEIDRMRAMFQERER